MKKTITRYTIAFIAIMAFLIAGADSEPFRPWVNVMAAATFCIIIIVSSYRLHNKDQE